MNQWTPSNLMRALVIVCISTLCLTAWAGPVTPVEDGYEASTDTIVLPSSNTGTVLRRDCTNCRWPSFNVNSQTQFFIGGSAVALSEFLAFARKNGSHFVMLFTKVDTPDLTRIVIADNSKPRAKNR